MADKIRKEDINEKEIIASFMQDEPTDHESLVGGSAAADEPSPTPQAEHPKEESRRKRGREQEYESLFVRASAITARSGKMVYVRREFHDSIKALCGVLGDDGITLSGYIDNVLAHHIETYGGDMNRLYNEKHKGLNIHKKQ